VNKHIDLRVTPQPILAGQNVQTIELYSGHTEVNIFTKIAFTYILVDVASYNNHTSYYHFTFKQWSPFSFASNFGIPSIFNPYLSRKCIIGINWLYTKPITTNPMKFSIIDAGNTTTTNINSFQYSNVFYIQLGLFCIQECASGYSANYTNSTYYCAYNPNTAYVFCQPNYFLVIATDQCYTNCPAGYYGNQVNFLCLNCLPDCLTCIDNSTCSNCLMGWPVDGGCTNVTGCISVNSTISFG
jgi:hypothetical protein